MHEQAQLAKLRRAFLGLLARLGGVRTLSQFTLSDAEKTALALRDVVKITSNSPMTTFAIPLVGAHQVDDWAVIEATLSNTLQALVAQSDPNWRVVICSQTCPDAISLDPRIEHVPFDDKIMGHDKVPKLARLAEYCLVETRQAGFFMPLDGDDLLHRDFVARMHADSGKGFLVCGGYIVDFGNARIGVTQNKSIISPFQKPFWKFCGSCMALPVGSDPVREAAFFHALANHEHRLYPYLAKLAGYALNSLIEPSALYVINHGENFETRRGRGGFKQRFVQRFEISEPAVVAKIAEDFPGSKELLIPHTIGL